MSLNHQMAGLQNLRGKSRNMCKNIGKCLLTSRQKSSVKTDVKHNNSYKHLFAIALFGGTCYMVYENKLWTREGRRICLVKLGGVQRFLRY